MLSLDRVRITTLGLLGLAAAAPSDPDEADTMGDAEQPPGSGDVFSSGAPIFEAVETALRKAGYLDA